MTAEQEPQTEHQLCQSGLGFDLDPQEDGSYDVEEEGFMCPNDAVGEFKLEVEGGGTMDFWLCEDCREQQEPHIVEEVTA